ncbi:hypothetical protein [Aurantiacibacter rhizosphaerae]|uniref:Uncharacterized protein n=1 Tax=Aurantiacibacter rhizosphaerae TaxID=2691582 RepID=A0A844XEM3_9SPHN|nr:hypothetical protein [Aurantiacibacter rhizosphaerae]MWV28122.1 hypothetical protein [Aurantiacibacter rhizosphaerae]
MHAISPTLLAGDSAITGSPVTRQVTRFAWHWAGALCLSMAAVLALSAHGDITTPAIILATGIALLSMGIADDNLTCGRLFGWPLITLTGALTLLAHYTT